jgi:hypothetical protein
MRTIFVKSATDLQKLRAQLLGADAGKDRTLQDLQRLNPHLDFAHIQAGNVLLVPEGTKLKDGDGQSVAGEAFAALQQQLMQSVDEATARVHSGLEAQAAQRQEVTSLLKQAAIKRVVQADPDLHQALDAAAAVFKQDTSQAKETEKLLQSLQQQAQGELAALAKLLG